MKKTKQPGENISLKTRKAEDPAIMSWLNAQTNLMDSLRYLIEIEISTNGLRNLQAVIPTERNVDLRIASYTAGSGEVTAAMAELAAGRHSASDQPAESSTPEDVEAPLEEEEIDEEDIESWT